MVQPVPNERPILRLFRFWGTVKSTNWNGQGVGDRHADRTGPSLSAHRFPSEVISYAVWLYFRLSLSFRMVDETLAARGIGVTYETGRQWGRKLGRRSPIGIARRTPTRGDMASGRIRYLDHANNIGSGSLSTRMASFSTS